MTGKPPTDRYSGLADMIARHERLHAMIAPATPKTGQTYSLRIIQTVRLERHITVQVEADSLEEAIEEIVSGSIDTPAWEDSRWVDYPDIMNEQVVAAT